MSNHKNPNNGLMVRVGNNGNRDTTTAHDIEKAIRFLRNKAAKAGHRGDMKRMEYFKSPSERRRMKHRKAAVARERKR